MSPWAELPGLPFLSEFLVETGALSYYGRRFPISKQGITIYTTT